MSAPIFKSDFSDMRLIQHVWRVFVLKVLSLLLGIGVIKAITANFGEDGMGTFSIYFSAVGVIGLLATFGFSNATLKLSAAQYKDSSSVLRQDHWSMLGLSGFTALILTPLVWVLAEPLAVAFFKDANHAFIFHLVAIALVPYVLLEVNAELVRGVGHSFSYMLFKEVGVWVVMVGLLFYFILGDGVDHASIVSHLVGLGVFSVLCMLVVMKLLRKGGRQGGGHSLRFLLNLSIPMLLSKGLILLAPHLTILALGLFTTPTQVGVYAVAYQLSSRVVSLFSYCMNVVVAPGIAYHFRHQNFQELEKLTKNSVRIAVWVSLPVVIIIIGGGEYFLGFFGDEAAHGWRVLVVLVLADFFDSMFGPVGYLLTMTGEEKTFGKVILGCTLVKIILLVILTPWLGIMGAAIAYMGYVLAWNLGSIFFIKRHLKFNPAYIPFLRY